MYQIYRLDMLCYLDHSFHNPVISHGRERSFLILGIYGLQFSLFSNKIGLNLFFPQSPDRL